MLAYYRLCKIFLLIDLQKGITEDDNDFLRGSKGLRMGFNIIFSRADKVDPKDWMQRAMALSFQLRSYHELINPICHLVSTQ